MLCFILKAIVIRQLIIFGSPTSVLHVSNTKEIIISVKTRHSTQSKAIYVFSVEQQYFLTNLRKLQITQKNCKKLLEISNLLISAYFVKTGLL
jgi:hypothetical protein